MRCIRLPSARRCGSYRPATSVTGRRLTHGSVVTVACDASANMDFSLKNNGRERRPENVPGSFYVDKTCINCDTCRWMAPATFARVGPQSAVVAQPQGEQQRVQALRALLSCPTYSIHATDRTSEELRAAQQGLPAPVPGLPPPSSQHGGVFYTGWAAEASFAGTAYLIVRPQGGNILVDSPRFHPALTRRMAELGGVRFMFLTHRDDVGDHQAWADHFGATRILHEGEVTEQQGTDKVEVKLSGSGPWVIRRDGSVVPVTATTNEGGGSEVSEEAKESGVGEGGSEGEPDVTLIFTPGHTRAHVCLYYAPFKVLFSGDHLASSAGRFEGGSEDQLYIFTDFNWFSVPEQLSSVEKLLPYDWLHVLPAHGRRAHLRDASARQAAVSDLIRQHRQPLQGHQKGSGGTAAAEAAVQANA